MMNCTAVEPKRDDTVWAPPRRDHSSGHLRVWILVTLSLGLSGLRLPAAAPAAERAWTVLIAGGEPRRIRDEAQVMTRGAGYLECAGPNNLVLADGYLGGGDFDLEATLSMANLDGSGASFVVNRSAHLVFGGSGGRLAIEGRFFVGREPARSIGRREEFFQPDETIAFVANRRGKEVTFLINGKVAHRMEFAGAEFGMIGFRPQQATLRIRDFRVRGDLQPLRRRTQGPAYSLPVIDLTAEKGRQVVIAQGTAEVYQGHPTTVLMEDRRTMFAVWTYDHGGHCGPLKRSDDGGLTWSELLRVPDNWRDVPNCPTIHRLTDPAGKERLIVYAGNRDMQQSVSEDGGRTWSPMQKNGLRAVVAPITVTPIAGQRHLAHYHWRTSDGSARLAIWQSVSADGGLTWEPGRIVATYPGADLCEPALIRSPDGKQLISVMRENTRRFNSLLIVSNDEGRTWSEPVELPASLTGDRHMPRYTHDGRLVITFRDMAPRSTTRGHFVAWVGRYDDIVALREGQYRVHLVKMHGYDSGYGGVEQLPDGTIAATTYCALAPGEKPSVVSVRFRMAELDARFRVRR